MEIKKIKETCLYVQDLDATKAFYEGKLKFEVIGQVPGRHIFFRAGESVLLCFISEVSGKSHNLPSHSGTGQLHLAFEVTSEEYDKIKTEIEAQHIQIEQEYDWGGGFLSFYFRDPDQHLLEVVIQGMWERNSKK